MTTTTRYQSADRPAIMEDAEWDAEATLSDSANGHTFTITVYVGDGAQYFVEGTRTASLAARGSPALTYGKYLADDTNLAATVALAVAHLNVDASLDFYQRVLNLLDGVAVDGAA